MRVAVLASGSGTNLQVLLERCRGEEPARVTLVLSNNPAAGALERARRAEVDTAVLAHPADADAMNAVLREHETQLVVLAGYMKLVPAGVVEAFGDVMINLHPALLPAFGGKGMYGLHVHRAVLASGATVTGATVHRVTHEYDRGPIIAQWPVPVSHEDTAESLAAKVRIVEHQILPAAVLACARAGRVVRLTAREHAFAITQHPADVSRMLETEKGQ